MLNEIKDFKGVMDENSIGATIYSYWHYFFYHSLLNEYTIKGKKEYNKTTSTTVNG